MKYLNFRCVPKKAANEIVSLSSVLYEKNNCFLLFYCLRYVSYVHNFHIKKVSDVNDDVRRAAVTGIGFLLFR